MELEPVRQFSREKFFQLVNNDKIAKNIEIGCYNFTIKKATESNLVKKWNNSLFKTIYLNKIRSIYSNLKKDSYLENSRLLDRLMSKEFLPHNLSDMTPTHIFPEHWKSYIDNKFKKEKAVQDNVLDAATDQFKCTRCKQKKCTYYEVQTRSADESMTIFITCLTCGKRWKN